MFANDIARDLAVAFNNFVRSQNIVVRMTQIPDPRLPPPKSEPIYTGEGRARKVIGHTPIPDAPTVQVIHIKANCDMLLQVLSKSPDYTHIRDTTSHAIAARLKSIYYCDKGYYGGVGGVGCLTDEWWALNYDRAAFLACLLMTVGSNDRETLVAIHYIFGKIGGVGILNAKEAQSASISELSTITGIHPGASKLEFV